MPTERQIKEAHEIVVALHPGARIKAVGPEGVVFEYPDAAALNVGEWAGRPFTGG